MTENKCVAVSLKLFVGIFLDRRKKKKKEALLEACLLRFSDAHLTKTERCSLKVVIADFVTPFNYI